MLHGAKNGVPMIPDVRVMSHMLRGSSALFHRLWEVPWYRATLTEWIDELGLADGARVVEVGSSAGDLTQWLDTRGFAAIGIDASASSVAQARKSHSGVRFEAASAESLPLEPESVDAVVGASLINVVSDPVSVAAEARRVLAPGAVASFLFPAAGFTDADARRVIADLGLRGFDAAALRTWHASAQKLEPDAVVRALTAAGLADARTHLACGGLVAVASARRPASSRRPAGLGQWESCPSCRLPMPATIGLRTIAG